MGDIKGNGRRYSYTIRRALAAALLLIVLMIFVLPSRTDIRFDRSVIRSSVDEAAEEPVLRAEAAELYSLDLDRPVYQKNADKRIEPYSVTKILTSYLVLENADLSRKVKVTEDKYLDYPDGSHMMAFAGEEFTVEDLLRATMLSSANDAAYFLAVEVAGSEAKFADMMNRQAEAWGCNNTHFVNPNGWKNKDHYTTAHDMAIITARCFENEALRELAGIRKYRIAETEQSEQRNYENFFWWAVADNDNILWGKTGSWAEDDCAIALEFSEDNLNAVIVLLRDTVEDRSEDIAKLQEYSHKITPGFIVAANEEGKPVDVVGRAEVRGGAESAVPVTFDQTVVVYPASESESDIKVTLSARGLEAPISKGSKVGRYSVIVDGAEIASGDLLAAEDMEKGWVLSKYYISNDMTILGAAVILSAASLYLLLRTKMSKQRSRKS